MQRLFFIIIFSLLMFLLLFPQALPDAAQPSLSLFLHLVKGLKLESRRETQVENKNTLAFQYTDL